MTEEKIYYFVYAGSVNTDKWCTKVIPRNAFDSINDFYDEVRKECRETLGCKDNELIIRAFNRL